MPSPEVEPPTPPSGTPTKRHWFFCAYLQIGISIVLSAASQLLMKRGADDSVHGSLFGFSGLASGWVWLGILAMIAGLASWLYALKTVPLNIAFNLACLAHALVPLSCWIFLGERIPALRWLGIALVIAGVFVVARPLMHLEEKL